LIVTDLSIYYRNVSLILLQGSEKEKKWLKFYFISIKESNIYVLNVNFEHRRCPKHERQTNCFQINSTCLHSEMTTLLEGEPEEDPAASIFLTISSP
jgi:hypothetical protein